MAVTSLYPKGWFEYFHNLGQMWTIQPKRLTFIFAERKQSPSVLTAYLSSKEKKEKKNTLQGIFIGPFNDTSFSMELAGPKMPH